MRVIGLSLVMALVAGCASDWTTPGYQAYRVQREATLVGTGAKPGTVPVALPVKAPTPAQIAAGQAAPAAQVAVVVTPATPVRATGPWPRQPVSAEAHARACANFYSAKAAQDAFLRAGGPQVDHGGLDPDGDGYACAYRPDAGL
ncbi:hypothetical protein ACEYYA_03060 [Paracoccus sp. p3-h83]|uniref:hypothetical protein n=1 Tax=Paracoccus sp. p3-h83 TaxID=3342805 RepID=UPI0035B88BD6